jgi:LysM repeat protein
VVPAERADAVLDHLAPPALGLSLASLTPGEAQLAVAAGRIGVALSVPDEDGPLFLAIEPDWQGPLLWAFEPTCGAAGTLTTRPCRVRPEWTTSGLVLDLQPVEDRRVTLALPHEGLPGWLQKPVAPMAAALVLAVGVGTPVAAAEYVVKPGDTLYAISRRYLGGGEHWQRLMNANRRLVSEPRRLLPGTRLHVPGAPVPAGRTVVVRRGDTLYGLAQRYLGDGAKWRQLWQGVRDRVSRPERLPEGLVLPLPGTKPSRPAPPAAAVRPSVQPSVPSGDLTEILPTPGPMEPPPASDAAADPSPLPAASPTPAASPSVAPSPQLSVAPEPSPTPEAGPSAPAAATSAIERPFGSHVALSYTPANVTEGLSTQSLSGEASVLKTFGARMAWRAAPNVELSGAYQAGQYVVDRGSFGAGPRSEQHGRVMAAAVLPVLPNLELAAGIGAQAGFYGAATMPVSGRPADYFDAGYQRVMADVEAKAGYRPLPDVPLTLTAGVSVQPIGMTVSGSAGLPPNVWGVGWQAGARYTVQGVALEAGYRGQRVWGANYQQSSDLLHGTVGYYFR